MRKRAASWYWPASLTTLSRSIPFRSECVSLLATGRILASCSANLRLSCNACLRKNSFCPIVRENGRSISNQGFLTLFLDRLFAYSRNDRNGCLSDIYTSRYDPHRSISMSSKEQARRKRNEEKMQDARKTRNVRKNFERMSVTTSSFFKSVQLTMLSVR